MSFASRSEASLAFVLECFCTCIRSNEPELLFSEFPSFLAFSKNLKLISMRKPVHIHFGGIGHLQKMSVTLFQEQIKIKINSLRIARKHERQKAAQPITHSRLVNRHP